MKNTLKVLGIILGYLFPILTLYSCQSSENNNRQNKPAVDTVKISMMKFNPSVLYVNKGDTVVWINNGLVDHNVTELKTQAWTSDTIHVGQTWKKAITDSFDYFCTIHPTLMKGKIELK